MQFFPILQNCTQYLVQFSYNLNPRGASPLLPPVVAVLYICHFIYAIPKGVAQGRTTFGVYTFDVTCLFFAFYSYSASFSSDRSNSIK